MKKIQLIGCLAISLSISKSQAQTKTEVISFEKITNAHSSFGSPLSTGDAFGDDVTAAGDIDGDGIMDLAAGADFSMGTVAAQGKVYILFMNANKTVRSVNSITIPNSSRFGIGVHGLGDFDKDGVPDLLVGAIGEDNYTGAVYVCLMKSDGSLKSTTRIASGSSNFTTLTKGELFGTVVSNLGDIDGDGVTDIIVGSFKSSDGGNEKGAVYVIKLNADATVKAYGKISDTKGNFSGKLDNADHFGSAVAGLRGFQDVTIAVGASGDDDSTFNSGAVYILKLDSQLAVKSSYKISNGTTGFYKVLEKGEELGAALEEMPGYALNDGLMLAVTATYTTDKSIPKGCVYLIRLDDKGEFISYQKLTDGSKGFSGMLANDDRFGLGFADMGRVTPNGSTHRIAVGTPFDDAAGENAGAVYVMDIVNASASTIGITDAIDLSEQVNCYPNPYTEQLTISLPASWIDQQLALAIYDVAGKEIYAESRFTGRNTGLILNGLPGNKGIYFLKLRLASGSYAVKKLIRN